MSEPLHAGFELDPDPDALAIIASALNRVGFDATLQAIRPDYFTSPHPNRDDLSRLLPAVEPALAVAIALFSFGDPVDAEALERALGRDVVEAGLITGLMRFDEEQLTVSLGGFSLVNRLGQLFVASANPYYPSFDPANADVYMGPDSFSLVNELHRVAPALPDDGVALDLCTGSGIAALSLARLKPNLSWTGIDLSPDAVAVANLNAVLNGLQRRYLAQEGDLFATVAARKFDLVTANPPFIPVPEGLPFPIYGAGGEDGRLVLGPLLRQLPRYLAPSGQAVIYGEGLGSGPRLDIEADVADLIAAGFDAGISIISAAPIEHALYTIGAMLARLKPSRLPEIVRWRDLFGRLGSELYAKFIIRVTPGTGSVNYRWCCPHPTRLAAMAGQRAQSEASE